MLLFERPVKAKGEADVAAMGTAQEDLERIARAAGVSPLSAFVSLDRRAYLAADMEPPENAPDSAMWFPAERGLDTVRALLRAKDSAFQDHVRVRAVREGLRSWEHQLERAAAERIGFRYRSFAI